MATKRKRKSEVGPALAATFVWDPTIEQGDMVCLLRDGATPHVYEVLACHRKVVMDHDLYNSPSLLARGAKSGDELCPALDLVRRRQAPGYQLIPTRSAVHVTLDASKVIKVTPDQIRQVQENLEALLLELRKTDD